MGMIQRDDMGWEGDSGLGAGIHLWWIHVNVWQNQYSIVKQNKVKKKKDEHCLSSGPKGELRLTALTSEEELQRSRG